MAISEKSLKKLIKEKKLVSTDDFNNALKVAKHLGCSVVDVLIGRDLIKERDLGKILSKYYQVDFVDLGNYEVNLSVLKLIPEDFAQKTEVVAFDKVNGKLYVAMEDPQDLELIELIKKTLPGINKIVPHVATKTGLKNGLRLYKSQEKEKAEAKVEKTEESPVTILEKLLEEAVRESASDIHIEPLEDRMLVRSRVDGVLHDEKVYEKNFHPPIVARIKILADLKLDETRLPQDGQFAVKARGNEKTSLRVSIMPTAYGEKVVLRILESTLARFNLEELGLLPEDQEIVEKTLTLSHGMFLITGPTGSGKTTSLYTMLGLLNKPEVNIVTIEDPVENKIKRINQIQVNQRINLTFANGLRSVLRQDPDIIMVGEIRDHETAVIATNAAMTGHLVFSTVHANTAAGVIPRMIDLGTEPFLLASTLNMIVAQRLVRILCEKCKKKSTLKPLIKKQLKSVKNEVSKDILKILKDFYEPAGCNSCHHTGFRGRVGIFELLIVDDEIKELITKKATSNQIDKVAKLAGSKSMLEDGIIKVAKGITTLDEVFRVTSD